MGEAHNFNYSMNSLRSNSISYLVAQPKVETRYNKKNLHAFQPFRAEPKVIDRREIMPTCLPAWVSCRFFMESSILKSQRSKCRLISFALIAHCAFMWKLSYEFIYVARFLRFFFKNKSSARFFQKYFSIFANKNISYQLFNYEFWSWKMRIH